MDERRVGIERGGDLSIAAAEDRENVVAVLPLRRGDVHLEAVVEVPERFGAVAVVSGKLKGQTQTLTLYVEQQFNGFQKADAYAVSVLLAFIAIFALIVMTLFRPNER